MTGNLRKAKEFHAHVPSLGAFALVMMTVLIAQGNLQAQTPRPGPCADARTMVGVGVRDVMAGYLEAGVRCPITPPLTLLLGWRYTAQRGYAWPVGILSYEQPLSPTWLMNLTASLHERPGDYEIDRLPELRLKWTPQLDDALVSPSVDLFTGYIRVDTPMAETERSGAALSLSTRSFVSDPRTNVSASGKVAKYWYGTGESYSYWTGSLTVAVRPVTVTEFALIYSETQGFGTSPLVFDLATPDRTVTGRMGFMLNSGDVVFVSAVLSLLTSPTRMEEYDLSWSKPGEWAATVTWRLTDDKVLFGFTLPP